MQRNKCPRTPDVMKAGLNRLFTGLCFCIYLNIFYLQVRIKNRRVGTYRCQLGDENQRMQIF